MADVSFTFSGDAASLQNALNEIKGEVRKTKDSVQGLAGQFTASFAAIGGAIAVAAFVVILVALCINSDKKLKAK